MAFDKTRERYASFGIATSLPYQIIDTFWDLLDNYLKGVVPLDDVLTFHLVNHRDNLRFRYMDSEHEIVIDFDYKTPFDPFYPETVHVVDDLGIETILLPHEFDL